MTDDRFPEVDYEDITFVEDLRAFYRGEKFTGRAVERDKNGRVTAIIEFVGGIQNGSEREYYPNGTLASETIYKTGIPHGLSKSWHPKWAVEVRGYAGSRKNHLQ
jgi:antitoxin component YwqK of YwqJK toxin-antitoxin module